MTDLTGWAQAWGVVKDEAPQLIERLRRELRKSFALDRDPPLWSPRTTGQWLLKQTGVDLEPLPYVVRKTIVNNACQHRMEVFDRGPTIPALHYYDGRAMYLGLCDSEIGCGLLPSECYVAGHHRGRYLVDFQVPDDWQHVGLLAVKSETGDGWDWPNKPGSWHQTYADCAEVRFAIQQGWRCDIRGAILLRPGRPLGQWGRRLVSLHQKAGEAGCRPLQRAYRAIALHTIGALHNLGTYDRETFVPEGAERSIPERAEVMTAPGGYTVTTREKALHWKPEEMSHPEWSAAIWSLCHLRVNKALLACDLETVLGVRGDAIYLSEPAPLEDDGKVGRLRLKGSMVERMMAPQTLADLTRLGREAEGG